MSAQQKPRTNRPEIAVALLGKTFAREKLEAIIDLQAVAAGTHRAPAATVARAASHLTGRQIARGWTPATRTAAGSTVPGKSAYLVNFLPGRLFRISGPVIKSSSMTFC